MNELMVFLEEVEGLQRLDTASLPDELRLRCRAVAEEVLHPTQITPTRRCWTSLQRETRLPPGISSAARSSAQWVRMPHQAGYSSQATWPSIASRTSASSRHGPSGTILPASDSSATTLMSIMLLHPTSDVSQRPDSKIGERRSRLSGGTLVCTD